MSLWLWPAVAIGIIALAGGLGGPLVALLVAAEAVAALLFVGGVLALRRERWATLGILAVVVGGLILALGWWQLHPTRWLTNLVPGARAGEGSATQSGAIDLRGRRIDQARARDTDFRGAMLAGANLDGLDLRGKYFDGADATGASLRGAHMDGVSLRGAILRGACLRGAHLQGADLTDADVTGADVAGVDVSNDAKKSAIGWPAAGSPQSTACR